MELGCFSASAALFVRAEIEPVTIPVSAPIALCITVFRKLPTLWSQSKNGLQPQSIRSDAGINANTSNQSLALSVNGILGKLGVWEKFNTYVTFTFFFSRTAWTPVGVYSSAMEVS